MTYQQPQQQVIYQPVMKQPTNGMAVASLVLGILAIVIGVWTPVPFVGIGAAFFAFLPAVLAVIFGHVGQGTFKRNGVGKGQAVTGLVLGYITIGLIVAVTMFWFVAGVAGAAASTTY